MLEATSYNNSTKTNAGAQPSLAAMEAQEREEKLKAIAFQLFGSKTKAYKNI